MARPPKPTKNPLLYLQHRLFPHTQKEKEGLARTEWFRKLGYAYNTLQTTRPATVGLMLADSPVALLAWIYEKLHDWTDSYGWTDDEILTWVSIYLFSRAGPAASARIYYESQNPHPKPRADLRVLWGYVPEVKLGLSYFPKDLMVLPTTYGRTLGPVVFERVHEEGGHFAAYEKPELLVGDVRAMFGKGGGAEGVARRLIKVDRESWNGVAKL